MPTETVPKYVKAVRHATVQMSDNTHRTVKENEPVPTDTLSEFFQEALIEENGWTNRLFTESNKEEYDAWIAGNRPPEIKDFDRRLAEMSQVILPGPDQVAEIKDGDAMAVEKGQHPAKDELSPAQKQAEAARQEGAEMTGEPVEGQTPNDGDSKADEVRAEYAKEQEEGGAEDEDTVVTDHSSTGAGDNPKTSTGTDVEPNDPGGAQAEKDDEDDDE